MKSCSNVARTRGTILSRCRLFGHIPAFFSLVLNLYSGIVLGIEYDLLEESPVGTVVGNVKRDSSLALQYSADDVGRLRFHMRPAVQGQQRFFALDENTGDVILAQVLDRETLCPYSQRCDLPFDVSVRPVQFYQIIKVVIHVVDINDNWPTFPRESVTINIPETALPGAMFMIPAAEDADSDRLGVQEYRLLSAYDALFQLVVTDQFDGAKDVRLKLGQRLDREKVDSYRLTVLAIDGGQPPNSGSISIDVVVVDSNDNSPQFENSTYEVEIFEDLPAASTLLAVHATDLDQGLNGEVRYSLADQTEAAYGQIFGVDSKSGEVFLKIPVDYEQHKVFHLTVQAADMGSGSLPAFAKVTVNVVDVNDNPPTITVNILTDSSFALIQENSAPGTFVAHAAVKDSDSGRNGQVQCFIDNRSLFELESLYDSEYTIKTSVSLDREESSSHELVLTCRDKGDTPLTSSRTIQVHVADENDNRPDLGLPSSPFEVRIYENTRPNTSVVKINATDLDIGPNGELVYHLRPLDETRKETFSVDPRTGNVITLKSLDYEQRIAYRFLLTVSDRGVEPLSATATLIISVLDINDERPSFDRSLYFLTIRENQPPGTIVGRVNATDRDLNADYRRVAYYLDIPSGVFDVNEQTGELTTLRRLDREEQETFRLSVTASNRGFPGMVSRVNVTIFVEDENDCPPVFLFPGRGVDTVELASHSAVAGTIVTRLSAIDRDLGRNAELTYDINSGNVDALFNIDPTTGVITLARKPTSVLSPHGDHEQTQHKLVVVARDGGVPSLLCVADLTVVFNNSRATAPQTLPGEASFAALLHEGNNMVILIGAVLGFVIVTASVVVAVVCVRRHRRHRRRRRHDKSGIRSRDDSTEISHRHCQSPSFSARSSGHRGGGVGVGSDRFGSFASTESGSAHRSVTAGCRLLQPHHTCECDDVLMTSDEDARFIDRIPPDWSGLQQDSGIIAHSDVVQVSCGSGEALPQQLTPSSSSSSSRCHGVSRTRSSCGSPHACAAHRCCSHGNRCGGGGGGGAGGGGVVGLPLLSSSNNRCRLHQSPSFRQHPSIAVGPHSPTEAVRMLQSSMKPMSHQEPNSCRDHDLESLGSASTWTDSGRGPSEEEDRLRSGQGQGSGQGSCLNCGSNLAQTGDTVSVIS